LATYLAERLGTWIDEKLESSTDKMFKFGLNFVKVARGYRLFGEAIRSGSVITIEHLWLRFCRIWKLLGKRIYVEIALNQVEDLYDRCDYWLLQTIRDNRTARFHDGATKEGIPLAQWSIDGMIENLQKRYKCMQFRNTEDDWCKHSINMAFVSMCITFVNTEYGKRYDVESMDEWNEGQNDSSATDNANKKKPTVVPKHIQEMTMVQEILKLSGMFVETPGRQFKGSEVWATLPNLTSNVSSAKEQYASTNEVDEDTQLLSQLFDSVDGEEEDDEFIETDDGNPLETLLDDDIVEDDDDNDIDNDNPGIEDDGSDDITEVTIGKMRKKLKNTHKAKVLNLALEDAFKAGQKKMIVMDYLNSRHRSRKRTRRERRVLQDALYYFVKKMGDNYSEVKNKLREGRMPCEFRPAYRDLVNNL
jgi:hypothetical protein